MRNIKKIRSQPEGWLLFVCMGYPLFFRSNCPGRTCIGASTAVDADIRVNFVTVTFRNSASGAFADASATSNADVRINFVCHNFCISLCKNKQIPLSLQNMRRFIFILTSFLFSMPFLSAQQNNGEVLQFDSRVHDFGQVLTTDGALSCDFVGKNVSNSTITIQSVTTSCGCTAVKWNHDPLAPGKSVKLSATYTNDEGPYPFDKTITVKIVGQPKPILLHMRGIVQEKIRPDSEIYTFLYGTSLGMRADSFKCGNLEQGGSRADQTTIANLSSKAIKVTFEAVSDGLSVQVKPNPIPAGSHATLYYTISARPDKWGYNDYTAVPVIDGKSSGRTISVRACTSASFSGMSKAEKAKGSRPMFKESTFSFGHKKQGATLVANFECTNKGEQPLKVYKADSDFAGAVPSAFPEIAPGRTGRFSVALDTKNLPKGEALIIITLTTNSPLRPIVTLFLAGWID